MDIKENLRIWNSVEHWETGKLGNGIPLANGEKWSAEWGSSRYQWFSSLLPRIDQYLPTHHIVEIACGRGRWSQYLAPLCSRLSLIDLSDNLVEFCRDRFQAHRHVECHVTDGYSIPGISDGSVDFVFSFDSLVHADESVMKSYIREIKRVLHPGGVAFLHHSNLADCNPEQVRSAALRDNTVSAKVIAEFARDADLAVRTQELVPWIKSNIETGQFIDCFTTLQNSQQDAPGKFIRNALFEAEKEVAKKIYSIYQT